MKKNTKRSPIKVKLDVSEPASQSEVVAAFGKVVDVLKSLSNDESRRRVVKACAIILGVEVQGPPMTTFWSSTIK